MVDEELKKHFLNKQVLWLVYGRDTSLYMDVVKVHDNGQWGYTVWGYSMYRRSPGFRTIGRSFKELSTTHPIAKLFIDQTEAIQYYMSLSGTEKTFDELRAEYTPNLKFLKRENYRHNLSVEI